MALKVLTIVGTRPEIIKLCRVIDELDQHVEHILVHTGQNYDYELNEIFFQELAISAEMVSRGWKVCASVRSREKIKSLPQEIQIIETGSIGPDTEWAHALDNVDSVVHLAGRVHVMDDSSSDPLSEYRIVNTAGTEKLARSAASSGVRRFIFMSTVKVTGEGSAA